MRREREREESALCDAEEGVFFQYDARCVRAEVFKRREQKKKRKAEKREKRNFVIFCIETFVIFFAKNFVLSSLCVSRVEPPRAFCVTQHVLCCAHNLHAHKEDEDEEDEGFYKRTRYLFSSWR